jgi:hypothetical protein
MFSESDLDGAVQAGALPAAAAEALRGYLAQQRASSAADEEQFRLVTGFNDIFVAIAGVILLVAVGWIVQTIDPFALREAPSGLAGLAVAASAWGLAEYFTRIRRMALPSILFLLAFAGGLFFGVAALAATPLTDPPDRIIAIILASSGAVTALGVWAHWKRFSVPITIAVLVAALVGGAMASLVALVPALKDHLQWAMLAAGFGVFALAMTWDVSDTQRRTRRADVAFWLHLLAAPLIAHPLFDLLGVFNESLPVAGALLVVALYVFFALVALAIDRRALLVSSLAYVLFALYRLFETVGAIGLSAALTALVIGSALLLLSAFWQVARRKVLNFVPANLARQLPMPESLQTA